MRIILVVIFLTGSLFLTMMPIYAMAQSPAGDIGVIDEGANDQIARKSIAELVSNLSKEEISVLSKLLKSLSAKEFPTTSTSISKQINIAEDLQSNWRVYSTFMWTNIIAFPSAIRSGVGAVLKIVSGRIATGNLQFALNFFLMLSAGVFAEFVIGKFGRVWSTRSRLQEGVGSELTLKPFARRLAVKFAKLGSFIAGALIAAEFSFENPDDHFISTSFVLYVLLIVRFTMLILRLSLAPKTPSMRLVTIDDWSAIFFHRNLVILTCIICVGLYLLQIMNHFQFDEVLPFRFWLGQYFHISLLYIIWRARKGISSIIRGEEQNSTPGLEKVATWWPILSMIAITIEVFIVQLGVSTGALDLAAGTGTIAIALIVFAPFFDTALRGLITHFLPTKQEEGSMAEIAHYEARNSYVRIGRVILIVFLFLSIGKLWGINYESLAEQGLGGQIAEKGGGFLFILAIGYFIWELINLWVNQQLAKDAPIAAADSAGENGTGYSRLATILPLISKVMQVSIIVLTVLLGLSQIGLNITPLLAGAGVFGLAIGFGAQALVKDVVSGIFFLWDDAFRVGEYIDIEGTVGTVEKISIRSLQLRHPNGPVHVIPYGEIPKLTNNSRDYVIMKLRFTVPFDTDIEKVRILFKKIGQDMMQNPELAKDFIVPFKSQGVVDVDDVGIVIRGKFTTKPGAQWMIRKEVYSRVQIEFGENGIQFARKEVRVQIPGLEDSKDLNPEQKQAIAAAAGEAVNIDLVKQGADNKKEDPL